MDIKKFPINALIYRDLKMVEAEGLEPTTR